MDKGIWNTLGVIVGGITAFLCISSMVRDYQHEERMKKLRFISNATPMQIYILARTGKLKDYKL